MEAGGFYDGHRRGGQLLLRLRPSRHLRCETTWLVDDVDLPGGEFTSQLLQQRIALALSPRILSSFFVQYNDLADLWSVNFRFNWIYRPGADVFVVYREVWDASRHRPAPRKDRQLIAKFTYLFQK